MARHREQTSGMFLSICNVDFKRRHIGHAHASRQAQERDNLRKAGCDGRKKPIAPAREVLPGSRRTRSLSAWPIGR